MKPAGQVEACQGKAVLLRRAHLRFELLSLLPLWGWSGEYRSWLLVTGSLYNHRNAIMLRRSEIQVQGLGPLTSQQGADSLSPTFPSNPCFRDVENLTTALSHAVSKPAEAWSVSSSSPGCFQVQIRGICRISHLAFLSQQPCF